ncbi:MAG: type IX secretion system membrane protein PorP/SprF [Crocinitomicaceae bacterium]|nr:MAG: type IX secretion system membrane protein PorP/SprF [Crocinitomicaceae bacterium]
MKKFLFCLFLGSTLALHAQQIPQYSQWFWNQLALNPAHSGIKPCVEIKTQLRTQWLGLEGAPNSGIFTFSVPLYAQRNKYLSGRQGLGFKVERDQIGPFVGNRFNVSYAGHFNFSKDDRLSVGISAGIQQWGFDKGKSTTLVSDPLVNESNSFVAPDAGLGFWWNGKNYYAGFILGQLTRSPWTSISADSRFKFHSVLNGGFRMVLKEGLTFMPNAILRFPPKGKISADINLILDLNNKVGVGLGYRNTDALMAFLQVKLKDQFSIGYSFDYVLSSVGRNEFFSHEISLSFSSCKSVNTNQTSCPLF